MSFNNFSSSVKLNNIKTYDKVNTTNSSFKNTFYSDIEEIDYSQINIKSNNNSINLEKGIEAAKNQKEWYEELWSVGASAINTTIGFVEGVSEFGEDIVDAAAWIGTIRTTGPFLFTDLAEGIFTGNWDFSNTGAHFNRTATFVRKECVDTFFDNLYEGPLKSVEDAAGDAFKRDGGFVYGISEKAGTYAATIAVSSAIPGGPVLAKGLTFGFSKFGDAIEDGIQKVTTNEDGSVREASVRDFAKETLVAGAKGAVEGGIMAGATKISESGKVIQSNLKNIGFSDTALKNVATEHKVYEIALKSTKPLANELVGLANGEEFNVNEVLVDTAAVVASEVVALKLKPYNPKIPIKADSNVSNVKVEAGHQAIQNINTATESSSIISNFWNVTKKSASEGINKSIEKAEKETVKTGVDKLVTLFD